MDDLVAADVGDAAGETGVGVIVVAVVALLDPVLDSTVAAHRRRAGDTGVGVVVVAVITLLDPLLDERVATDREHAGVEAGVGVVGVAVVAGLVPALDPVAAAQGRAAVAALIVVDVVAVVTGLTGPEDAVAAGRDRAEVRARVAVLTVAVVTLLTVVDDTVAAARGRPGGLPCGGRLAVRRRRRIGRRRRRRRRHRRHPGPGGPDQRRAPLVIAARPQQRHAKTKDHQRSAAKPASTYNHKFHHGSVVGRSSRPDKARRPANPREEPRSSEYLCGEGRGPPAVSSPPLEPLVHVGDRPRVSPPRTSRHASCSLLPAARGLGVLDLDRPSCPGGALPPARGDRASASPGAQPRRTTRAPHAPLDETAATDADRCRHRPDEHL